MQELRPRAEFSKQLRPRARHPGLSVEGADLVIKSGAATCVKMGGDLVQQEDRRRAEIEGERARIGEDQGDQQRLLLSGGGIFGRDPLGRPIRAEVDTMRPDQRSPGLQITSTVVAQHLHQRGFVLGQFALGVRDRKIRRGKGGRGVARRVAQQT